MATKSSTGTQVINGATSSAGSSYASPSSGCQSADQSQATNLGCLWTLRGTNGGTGPTVGCSWQVDVSYDGAAWRQYAGGTFGVANSTSYDAVVELGIAVMHTRVTFFGNTGQSVTVYAELQQATGIA